MTRGQFKRCPSLSLRTHESCKQLLFASSSRERQRVVLQPALHRAVKELLLKPPVLGSQVLCDLGDAQQLRGDQRSGFADTGQLALGVLCAPTLLDGLGLGALDAVTGEFQRVLDLGPILLNGHQPSFSLIQSPTALAVALLQVAQLQAQNFDLGDQRRGCLRPGVRDPVGELFVEGLEQLAAGLREAGVARMGWLFVFVHDLQRIEA